MRRVVGGWFNFVLEQSCKPPGHGKAKRLFPLVLIKVVKKLIKHIEQRLQSGIVTG
jgi:hypothetical protein